MVSSFSIGATATVIASLGTLFSVVVSFVNYAAQYGMSIYTGIGFPGASGVYAFFAWFGVVALIFGWASAACTYMHRRYELAATGAFLIWLSAPVGFFSYIFALHGSMIPINYTPIFILSFLQFLASSIGLFFTIKSRKQFVN
jgi:hypothetical protein